MRLFLRFMARWGLKGAEPALEKGQIDEALAAVDKELKENAALETEKDLLPMGWLVKAKALGAKAEKLKASGDAAGASTAWKDAMGLLKQVIAKGGATSVEGRDLLAKFAKASGDESLDADMRLALAEGNLSDASDLAKNKENDKAAEKYKDAIAELRRIVDNPAANVPVATAFKAQRMLAWAYQASGELQKSKQEFDSLFRLYGGKMPKDELADRKSVV